MKKLNKDILKSITHSWGRFISIVLLMALGSFAFIGLLVTGPDMRITAQKYFDKYNTADISIISDYGIDDSEIAAIEKASKIKDVEYFYLKDVTIENTDISVRIFSKPEDVSLYELKEGKYPSKSDEIAIDYEYADKYDIGDTICFTEKLSSENEEFVLKNHQYKIVGFVYSTEILSSLNKGQTTVGTGELDSYAIINKENFNSDVYMMAKVIFKDTENVDPYSNEYTNLITKHKKELSNLLNDQQGFRFENIKSKYQAEVDDAKAELNSAWEEFENTKRQLDDAKKSLSNGQEQIDSNELELLRAKKQIENAEMQILNNEKTLSVKQSEYDKSKSLLDEKQKDYNLKNFNLNEKLKSLEELKEKIEIEQNELNDKKNLIENEKEKYEVDINSLNERITVIQNVLMNEELTEEEILSYQTQLLECNQNLDKLKKEYDDFINNTYSESLNEIEESQKNIDAKKEESYSLEKQLNIEQNKLLQVKQELDNGYFNLSMVNNQLKKSYYSLNSAKDTLNESKLDYNYGVQQLTRAKNELIQKEKEYNQSLQKFNEKEEGILTELKNSELEINDFQKQVDSLEAPIYSIYTRREIPGSEGYDIYTTISEIVDSLSKIFPVFLYFVAALVTLTTMTRFVTEERINLGTLKSLGYKDRDIIKKFVVYGFIAGMFGTILGVILGHILLPYIVYNAYDVGFTYPKIELHFYPLYTLIAIILSLCSSVIPAYIVAKRELQEMPSLLLLPKAPKAGSKIMLEKITPIWNKMSFTHKVTARNLFRYKSRMLMTIFGVAGATALLFTGFSVRNSIAEINQRQFSDIIKYEMIVVNNDVFSQSGDKDLINLLESDEVKNYLSIYYESALITAGEKNDDEEIKVIVPRNQDDFRNYINLVNRQTQNELNLEDDGVIVSERLAELLNLKVGSVFEYKDSKENIRKVKVSGICEMYTGHFIFMNKKEYEKVYETDYENNANLILLNDGSISNTKKVAAQFMKLSSVKGVSQNTTLYNQIDTIAKSLNKIMTVLIIVASLLSIVIIYNLTNINVSERIRELSTIKVLGFRDKEVTMYIYRETIILTIIAIAFGFIIGLGLHKYILDIVPPDDVMFNPNQWIGSFVIPAVIILFVSLLMKVIVNNKLKKIDMLEALKSVD